MTVMSQILQPPGSVTGISYGGERWVTARGVANLSGDPVTENTVFDLASVTKTVATTCLLQRLAVLGLIELDHPIRRYLPWTTCTATLRTLAYHRAGLWEWQPLYLSGLDPVGALAQVPARYPEGQARRYSDLGFMLLGLAVQAAATETLDVCLAKLVAANLPHTGYSPRPQGVAAGGVGDRVERQMVETGDPYPVLFTNPDFVWREAETVGQCNDGNAYHGFGGVAGHAGLFSNAPDLLTLAASLAQDDNTWGGELSRDIFADGPDAGQAFGWRTMPVTLDGHPETLVWHPGFTGCALGFVPNTDCAVVMLTNRLLDDAPSATADLWQVALADAGRHVPLTVREGA
ncbi:MAG: beta-lactamase family protein [Propionibacteriaceae bacterium]|nr:beta-lactamase family protein [Propionibacteriaceae bacterium]